MTDDVTRDAVRNRLAAVIYAGLLLDAAEARQPAEVTAGKAMEIAEMVMRCFTVLVKPQVGLGRLSHAGTDQVDQGAGRGGVLGRG